MDPKPLLIHPHLLVEQSIRGISPQLESFRQHHPANLHARKATHNLWIQDGREETLSSPLLLPLHYCCWERVRRQGIWRVKRGENDLLHSSLSLPISYPPFLILTLFRDIHTMEKERISMKSAKKKIQCTAQLKSSIFRDAEEANGTTREKGKDP